MPKRKPFKGYKNSSASSRGPTHRDRRGPAPRERRRPGRAIWIYGVHAVQAALGNPDREIRRVLATEAAAGALAEPPSAAPPLAETALAEPALAETGPSPEIVTNHAIEAVLPAGAVHQGLALLAEPLAPVSVKQVCERCAGAPRAAVVVLDRVSDPRNIGAVLRSAAVFGAAAVIVPDRHTPEATGALAKAASGALETVPLVRTANLARALDTLKRAGFWCAGLDADAETAFGEADMAPRIAFVLGAEGAGLRRLTLEACDFRMRIPGAGAIATLNVSNAVAVALYEFARAGHRHDRG